MAAIRWLLFYFWDGRVKCLPVGECEHVKVGDSNDPTNTQTFRRTVNVRGEYSWITYVQVGEHTSLDHYP